MHLIRKIFLYSSVAKAHKRKKRYKNGERKNFSDVNIQKRKGLVNKETNKDCVFVDISLTLFRFCISSLASP